MKLFSKGASTTLTTEQVLQRRNIYFSIAFIMFAFIAFGIIASKIMGPEEGEWKYLWVNIGSYGFGGVSALYMLIVVGVALAVFVHVCPAVGLFIGMAIAGVVLGVGVTLFTKVFGSFYQAIPTDFVISFLGITIDGTKEIPVSSTVGNALLNNLIYTVPFVFCTIKAIQYSRKI